MIARPTKFLALAATVAGLLVAAQPAVAAPAPLAPLGPAPVPQVAPQPAVAAPAPLAPLGPAPVPQVAPQPASTYASCPAVVSSQLLSGFGDSSYYAPLSGGTFEGSTAGWSFTNASVVSGNEPWNVVSSADSESLSLSPGGSATSPSFCLDTGFPSFRFFAENTGGGPAAGLNVQVQWTDAQGNKGSIPVSVLSAGNYLSWQLSPSLALGSALADGTTVSAQLVFSATPTASWNIDDILLDPYAK